MHMRAVTTGTLLAAFAMELAKPAESAHYRRSHHFRAPAARPEIACTVVGCISVPRGCYPVPGRTPGGIPTGFDVIVCPPGVQPIR